MSAVVCIPPDGTDSEHRAFMEELAAFFSEAIGDQLRGTGMAATLRRAPNGCELWLRFQDFAVLTIDDERRPKSDADKPEWFERRQIEAAALVRSMRAALQRYADGKGDE